MRRTGTRRTRTAVGTAASGRRLRGARLAGSGRILIGGMARGSGFRASARLWFLSSFTVHVFFFYAVLGASGAGYTYCIHTYEIALTLPRVRQQLHM